MKLLHMYNAFYDVCVLYNPETFYFFVFYLDSGVNSSDCCKKYTTDPQKRI